MSKTDISSFLADEAVVDSITISLSTCTARGSVLQIEVISNAYSITELLFVQEKAKGF
jgi:hypothetical protein